MNPRIEILKGKRLIGKSMIMTFSGNKTVELWKSFMPRRKEITNNIGSELYSMQIYEPLFFNHFDPDKEFEKWAAVEVSDFDTVPGDMETFTLAGGLYAVFLYRGTASTAAPVFQYILGNWLPASEYILDDRPHFELLGEKYKKEDPDSEEEIWIPVKPKTAG
jgi:AraC family transcriptional regulator